MVEFLEPLRKHNSITQSKVKKICLLTLHNSIERVEDPSFDSPMGSVEDLSEVSQIKIGEDLSEDKISVAKRFRILY